MNTIPTIVPILAGGMLFAAFVLASRMRLFSLIFWFRTQSVLLGIYTAVLGNIHHEWSLYASALFVLAAKAILVPILLSRAATRPGVSQKLESYVRPTTLSLVAGLVVLSAFFAARTYALPHADYLVVAAALSLFLIGFLLLVARRDLFGQVVGFLTLENGIFVFGLALVSGMPLFLEIGVSLDVLIGFVLMTALLNRTYREYASVHTDRLRELIG